MNKSDATAFLSYIASMSVIVADSSFQSAINNLFGPYASKIIAGLTLAAILATGLLHINSKETPSA